MQEELSRLLNRLRMRQIGLMLAIDARGSLRAAAQALGMTQPAATKMLQELESALGQPLFERVGRRLRCNAAGECAMAHFRRLRGTMESLVSELAEVRDGGGGRLRVGSVMAASPEHLTRALLHTRGLYPLLQIKIDLATSDQLLAQLDEGALDVAICGAPLNPRNNYVFRPLSEELLSVVVSVTHGLAGRRLVTFQDLQVFPWVLQPAGTPAREVVEREFRSNQTPLPRGLIETPSMLTTTHLIGQSDMIAIIPHSIAERHEQHGLLRIVPYRMTHRLAPYGSAVRRDRPTSRAAERFIRLLHAPADATQPAS